MFTVKVEILDGDRKVRFLSFVVERDMLRELLEVEVEALVDDLVTTLGRWQRAMPGMKFVDLLVSRSYDGEGL